MSQPFQTVIMAVIVLLLLNANGMAKGVSLSDETEAINPLEHPTWVPSAEERKHFPDMQEPDEVRIGGDFISMPLSRFLLVRKGAEYCALKFTNTWLGGKYPLDMIDTEFFTSYDFYCQGDGSGDFSKGNVKTGAEVLHLPKTSSFLGFPYLKKPKIRIRCGRIELKWWVISTVILEKDIEVAPTPWRSINEVNINDPRIKWYRKGTKFNKVPIEYLWKDKGEEKKDK